MAKCAETVVIFSAIVTFRRRTQLGLRLQRLQRLLEQMDAWVAAEGLTETSGEIGIGQGGCAFAAEQGQRLDV